MEVTENLNGINLKIKKLNSTKVKLENYNEFW